MQPSCSVSAPESPGEGTSRRRDYLDLFFRHTPDAVLMVRSSGIIFMVNPAVTDLLGYEPDELVGQALSVLIPDRFSDHGERMADYFKNPIPRPMARGLDLHAAHRSGQEIPVDISLTPIRFSGEQVVACSMRDLRGRSFGTEAMRLQATALRSAANGVVITDLKGIIIWCNPSACQMTGYAESELLGRHTRLLKSGLHDSAFYRDIWLTLMTGNVWTGIIVNRRKDGEIYYEEQTIAPVLNDEKQITNFIAIKQDITEKHQLEESLRHAHEAITKQFVEIQALNEQLHEQAVRDPLTGLHNRRFLFESLEREAAAVARSGEPLAVAILDVDRFKSINDTHGHAVGDLALRAVASCLKERARKSDLVCRLGGEEFVVVMRGAALEMARTRAEEWRKAVANIHFAAVTPPLELTVSGGVAVHLPGKEHIDKTLDRADRALYFAKTNGRNRVMTDPEVGAACDEPPPGARKRQGASLV